MRFRVAPLSALAVALLLALAGCGDGDSGEAGGQPEAAAAVDCLSEEGLTVEASNLDGDSPDIQVMSGAGEIADVLVEGSGEDAEHQAAEVKGARESFGTGQTVVVSEKSAVIVFEDAPSAKFRQLVVTCVD